MSKFRPINENTPQTTTSEPAEPEATEAAFDWEGGGPDHLDGIDLEEPEGTEPEAGGAGAGPQFIGADEFHQMFCGVFGIASAVSGLKSLHVDRADERAGSATMAIYEIAQETPSLHFLLQPGGVWMQRAFAIGAFAVPMASGVAAELKLRKQAALAAKRAAQANDNYPKAANDNAAHMAAEGVPVA